MLSFDVELQHGMVTKCEVADVTFVWIFLVFVEKHMMMHLAGAIKFVVANITSIMRGQAVHISLV